MVAYIYYISAQLFKGTKPDDLGIPAEKNVNSQVASILNLVYAIAGIVAVIVIIIAGIQYSLSTGNSQKVSKAKDAIIYSMVGLVVVASAFAITNFILGRI